MMRAVHVAFFLCLLLITQPAVGRIDVARRPAGSYCGDYLGVVKGRISTGAARDTFDIWLDAFGDKYSCKKEKYTFDERTNQMTVVGATDPKDCLGKILIKNGLSLTVSYSPKEDVLDLDLGIVRLQLTACA
ncbi:uncharacterized protein Tco025E_08541 [Trypanosoma conorhini]|uniref:Uncharacterized protein n=1 Tax=Trypanosoma conorhini TaxID=83891 RepID=A0A422N8T1_9TRYP|nr:uncharacterized protein Tco025E_08541 [Trypanosoma conorhini]RNF01865.1 hypothetical protein Tco025E_08541 [Trypanosoma conorhini]